MTILKYSNTTVLEYIELFKDNIFYYKFTFKIEVAYYTS
jgi:hypothetical protein